jgi:hypothetical protein
MDCAHERCKGCCSKLCSSQGQQCHVHKHGFPAAADSSSSESPPTSPFAIDAADGMDLFAQGEEAADAEMAAAAAAVATVAAAATTPPGAIGAAGEPAALAPGRFQQGDIFAAARHSARSRSILAPAMDYSIVGSEARRRMPALTMDAAAVEAAAAAGEEAMAVVLTQAAQPTRHDLWGRHPSSGGPLRAWPHQHHASGSHRQQEAAAMHGNHTLPPLPGPVRGHTAAASAAAARDVATVPMHGYQCMWSYNGGHYQHGPRGGYTAAAEPDAGHAEPAPYTAPDYGAAAMMPGQMLQMHIPPHQRTLYQHGFAHAYTAATEAGPAAGHQRTHHWQHATSALDGADMPDRQAQYGGAAAGYSQMQQFNAPVPMPSHQLHGRVPFEGGHYQHGYPSRYN